MLPDRFQSYIKENSLVEPGEKVLLAVSGGVDSMVMLSLFASAGYGIGVAHCNFQLRGAEADEDEEVIERTCAAMGVPHYNIRFDTMAEMEATGESVQMAARRLRYTWFDQLCNDHGYNVIAIAHHADDSVETFFINLLRGTGLRGLTGISVTNGRVIRPLLFATRKEILDYAHANKIAFREDSSNRSTKYLRNKVRLGLVPRIREINPKFTELMSRNVQRLTEAQQFISHGIERIREEILTHENGLDVIDPGKIDAAYPANFVIYELLSSYYGFKGDVVDALCRSLHHGGSGKRFYAREHVAMLDRGRIIVAPIAEDDTCNVEVDARTHKAYCSNSVVFFEHINIDDVDTPVQPSHIALVDADKLTFPLTLRRWADGDSFIPFGMTGHKKVSDLLVDEKVPLAEKQRQAVVCSGEQIVWVVGRRIDDRFRITDGTENVLRMVREIY